VALIIAVRSNCNEEVECTCCFLYLIGILSNELVTYLLSMLVCWSECRRRRETSWWIIFPGTV